MVNAVWIYICDGYSVISVLVLVKYLLFTVPRYPPGGSYQYMFGDGLASLPCERMLMQPDMHSDTEGHKVGF